MPIRRQSTVPSASALTLSCNSQAKVAAWLQSSEDMDKCSKGETTAPPLLPRMGTTNCLVLSRFKRRQRSNYWEGQKLKTQSFKYNKNKLLKITHLFYPEIYRNPAKKICTPEYNQQLWEQSMWWHEAKASKTFFYYCSLCCYCTALC